jgi:hypothetical protein
MARKVARRFFQCVFYQLVARLWFWSRSGSQFVVRIDPRHFFAVLEAGRNRMSLDRLLGERLQECYVCNFDLPADRASMRQLIGPFHAGQSLTIRNFGSHVELSARAKSPIFYGVLSAMACFYF